MLEDDNDIIGGLTEIVKGSGVIGAIEEKEREKAAVGTKVSSEPQIVDPVEVELKKAIELKKAGEKPSTEQPPTPDSSGSRS
jgi:hypothetical protein